MPAQPPRPADPALRRDTAVTLKAAGRSWSTVAAACGYSDSKSVRRAVRTELDRRIRGAEQQLAEARRLNEAIFGGAR